MALYGGTAEALDYTLSRLIGEALAFIFLGAWLLVALFRPGWRPSTLLAIPLASVLLVFGVSSLMSENQRVSGEFLSYATLMALAYLFLVALLRSDWIRNRIFVLVAVLTAVIAGGYVLVVLVRWIEWWGLVGRPALPPLRPNYEALSLGNPTVVGTMAILLLGATWAHNSARPEARRPLRGLTLLVGLAVLMTGSRGTLVAVAVAVTAWFVLPIIRQRLSRLGRGRMPVPPGRTTGMVLAAGLLAIATIPILADRLTQGGGGEIRYAYAAASIRMFLEHPVTGVGPGMWGPLRASFTTTNEVDYYLAQAHNLPLQSIAEFGVLGALAGVLVVVGLIRLLRLGHSSENPRTRAFARAAGFGATFLAVQELVDPFATWPTVLLALALPIAQVEAALPRASGKGVRSTLVVAAFAAMLAVGTFLVTIERGAWASGLAAEAHRQGDLTKARTEAADALAADPFLPVSWFTAGVIAADAGFLDEAAYAFATAARDDDFSASWLNLAAVEVERRDHEAARVALDRAMRLGWQQPGMSYAAGFLYNRIGLRPEAVNSFAYAIAGAAQLADEKFWSTADIRPLRDSAIDAALQLSQGNPRVRFEVAVYGGRTAASAEAEEQLEFDDRATAHLVKVAWGGDAEAYGFLLSRAQDRPLDVFAVGWAARVARLQADEGAVLRLWRWLELIDPLSLDRYGREVVVAWGRPQLRLIRGANALGYGHTVYRRPIPRTLFVIWVPRLAYDP